MDREGEEREGLREGETENDKEGGIGIGGKRRTEREGGVKTVRNRKSKSVKQK